MELIAQETLHDILLKLPTRDVARCRCVCKSWRRLLTNPSFCRLHARAGSVSGGSEALLVSQARRRGKTMETNVLSVSSPKAMCRVVDLAEGYRVMSVCNGFIVLASGEKEDPSKSGFWDPLFVCNPVTGEKLEVPAPPALKAAGHHLFVMGFCATSNGDRQYKLFRLPFQEKEPTTDDNHLDVYTFGGGRGRWRRHPDPFRRQGVCWAGSPPVLVDGKIYVLTKHKDYVTTPNNVVVIDVASEAHSIYYLMMNQRTTDAGMCMLDLGGQPCIAVHVPIPYHPGGHSELHLWVMPTPQLVQGARQPRLEKKLLGHWTRRYSFSCDRGPIAYTRGYEVAPMGIWVEGGGIVCCIIGDYQYKYDTTKHIKDDEHKDDEDVGGGRFSAWDQKLRLPSPPNGCYKRRGIYGGYRPTLLPPGDLAAKQDDDVGKQFQHAWLQALRCPKSSDQCPDNGSDKQHVAKRRRRIQQH